jgi:hypothetical protein
LREENEDAIAQVWNDLIFDDLQRVFYDWIRYLAWVPENGREYISESNTIRLLMSLHVEIEMGPGIFWTPSIFKIDHSAKIMI